MALEQEHQLQGDLEERGGKQREGEALADDRGDVLDREVEHDDVDEQVDDVGPAGDDPSADRTPRPPGLVREGRLVDLRHRMNLDASHGLAWVLTQSSSSGSGLCLVPSPPKSLISRAPKLLQRPALGGGRRSCQNGGPWGMLSLIPSRTRSKCSACSLSCRKRFVSRRSYRAIRSRRTSLLIQRLTMAAPPHSAPRAKNRPESSVPPRPRLVSPGAHRSLTDREPA